MMYGQRTTLFGPVQKALAGALHTAGQTDREIADAIGTAVNNVIHWRGEAGLSAHLPAGQEPVKAAAPVRAATSAPAAPPPMPPVRPIPVRPPAAPQAPAPAGDNALEIGVNLDRPVHIDLEELLTTRLLVQGNSGSGKSHLLRKVIEESTGIIQQVIIDPEGDFVSIGETFGHTIVNGHDYPAGKMAGIGARVRQHRGSVVLNLEELDAEDQMASAAAFLTGMFDAPREHWFPALVFVDEAQLFAPSANNGEDGDVRRSSLLAMTNLMCRGRKRGLAGVLATQRLAKLHKNVAAEASNFLMGRTFLDIDIARAADLLGLRPQQAEQIRDLARGEFLGLGPAISRKPLKVTIGSVMTQPKTGNASGLVPLPSVSADEMQGLMLPPEIEDEQPAPVVLRVVK